MSFDNDFGFGMNGRCLFVGTCIWVGFVVVTAAAADGSGSGVFDWGQQIVTVLVAVILIVSHSSYLSF